MGRISVWIIYPWPHYCFCDLRIAATVALEPAGPVTGAIPECLRDFSRMGAIQDAKADPNLLL